MHKDETIDDKERREKLIKVAGNLDIQIIGEFNVYHVNYIYPRYWYWLLMDKEHGIIHNIKYNRLRKERRDHIHKSIELSALFYRKWSSGRQNIHAWRTASYKLQGAVEALEYVNSPSTNLIRCIYNEAIVELSTSYPPSKEIQKQKLEELLIQVIASYQYKS